MCGVLEEFDENRKAGLLVLYCVEPTGLSYALFDWLLYAESHFHPSEIQKLIFDPETSSSLCDYCQNTLPPRRHFRTGSVLQLQFFTLIDKVRCQSTIPRQPGEPWQLQSSGAALGRR